MSSLPKRTTLDKINILTTGGYPRPHLGGSLIAHPCERYLVYSFRWAYMSKIESKLNRIFRLGDAIEDIMHLDTLIGGLGAIFDDVVNTISTRWYEFIYNTSADIDLFFEPITAGARSAFDSVNI